MVVAPDRQNNIQGRPLKPSLASNRTSKTPLTPRLATNAKTPASAISNRSATKPSTPTPTLKSSTPVTRSGTPISKSATAPPKSSIHHDDDTPIRPLLATNITPRSSSRKSRVGPSMSPLVVGLDDTPSLPRARTISPTNEQNGIVSRPGSSLDSRLVGTTSRARSVVGGGGGSAVGGGTGGAPVKDVTRPTTLRLAGHSATSPAIVGNSVADNDSKFFHANEAKRQEAVQKRPEVKKTPSFFYANGQGEDTSTPQRSTSPVLSALAGGRPSPGFFHANGLSEPTSTPPILSPALSGLSSISPYFPPPVTSPTADGRPTSPTKENIHLSYRKGISQIFAIPSDRPRGSSPGHTPTHTPTVAERLTPTSVDSQRRVNGGPTSRNVHAKSPSMSSIGAPASPASRRRSHSTTGAAHTAGHATSPSKGDSPAPNDITKPTLQNINTKLGDGVDLIPEIVSSPTKSMSDLAADARRERKVLDLEISNSSLLAINKSLEREMRKQKAELKRYRRLSRAGQFAVSTPEHFNMRLSSLNEEESDLPDFDGLGRPSSPFVDEAGDMSDDDSITSSATPPSPGAQADSDARHRVKDERRLQMDLEKHRELLLDTQRMNQVIQRCLFWTDGLLRDGRKALDYEVRKEDVKMGGRILAEEEEGSEHDDERDQLQVGAEEEDTIRGDRFGDASGHLGIWGHRNESGRSSVGSERTDRDSGIEVEQAAANFDAFLSLGKGGLDRPSVGETW